MNNLAPDRIVKLKVEADAVRVARQLRGKQ